MTELALDLGVELDLVTKKDLEREVNRAIHDLKAPYNEKIFKAGSGSTDSNGLANFPVWAIPAGKTFSIYKLILWADTYDPGHPFSAATAWAGIFHGNPTAAGIADFFPYTNNTQLFPFTTEYGDDAAPEFRNRDTVYFHCENGPVSKNITCMLFGQLKSLKIRNNDIHPHDIVHKPGK